MKKTIYSIIAILIMLSSCVMYDNGFKKVKLQNNYEFKKSLQRFFIIEVDSLNNLKGELYSFYKRARYGVYENSKIWSIFSSDNKEILKNKILYHEVIKKDDKLFFLEKIKRMSKSYNANTFIEIDNIENVDCFFHYGKKEKRDASVKYLSVLIHNKVTNYYYYGRYTGELVDDSVIADYIEVLPLRNFKNFESPLSDITDIYGNKVIVPYVGEYTYLKFKSDNEVVLKHKSRYTKYTQKEKDIIKKILEWLTVVDKNHSLRSELEKVTFDTCYYRCNENRKNRFYVEWLAYDEKSKYYYFGECFGFNDTHKYIYKPF